MFPVQFTTVPVRLILNNLDTATRLVQTNRLLTSILDALPYAVMIRSKGGTVLFKNRSCGDVAPEHSMTLDGIPELELCTSQTGSERELLQILAHQLRTPVTGVIWNAELAADASGEQLTDLLSNIRESGDKLNRTVKDLILALELQHDLSAHAPVRVDLITLLRETAAALDLRDRTVNISVTRNRSDDLTVSADQELLRSAFLHIMQNSIDYTQDNTTDIRISLTRDSNKVAVSFSDDGPGMGEESSRVTERFYRGSMSRKTKPDGNGLGLYIADQVAKRHKGKLTVDSSPSGTTVSVEIPTDVADS
ncbi:MAG: Signal transduction histidine-protein kinase BaeS [candidate division WS6 bacterium OLB20]|uniref:histidine kinase n=1 Tax=candidate division WS6 bacterium OLB20 TaxID=1617426 RepID=A0A136LY27_9BACT|nr:MAG: Signal transduction histidine-protein kinase BaeS [candidate division WS6 bacterium OLB20]